MPLVGPPMGCSRAGALRAQAAAALAGGQGLRGCQSCREGRRIVRGGALRRGAACFHKLAPHANA